MPAREKQHIPLDRPQASHNAVGPRRHISHRFAARPTVMKDIPGRILAMDLIGAEPFVRPIVPLDEVWVDPGRPRESGQFARSPGALQRTGENRGKSKRPQPLAEAPSILLTARRKRQIRPPRVLPGKRPGRFTVPGQAEDG